jgi:hypothetical protein
MLTSRPVKPERRADKRGRSLSVLTSCPAEPGSVLISVAGNGDPDQVVPRHQLG